MRRRPLLRAAAVGGGAYMAGKRRAANQDREAGQEERISNLEQQGPPQAQAPPQAPSGVSSNGVERLRQLGQLHEEGVLTDEEFAQQKAKILSSG